MKSADFGAHIKSIREGKGIPQRIVAHALNVDTSTLSKMELGERKIPITMIKPLSESLDVNFKDLQIKYIAEKIMKDFSGQPFLNEALKNILNKEV